MDNTKCYSRPAIIPQKRRAQKIAETIKKWIQRDTPNNTSNGFHMRTKPNPLLMQTGLLLKEKLKETGRTDTIILSTKTPPVSLWDTTVLNNMHKDTCTVMYDEPTLSLHYHPKHHHRHHTSLRTFELPWTFMEYIFQPTPVRIHLNPGADQPCSQVFYTRLWDVYDVLLHLYTWVGILLFKPNIQE